MAKGRSDRRRMLKQFGNASFGPNSRARDHACNHCVLYQRPRNGIERRLVLPPGSPSNNRGGFYLEADPQFAARIPCFRRHRSNRRSFGVPLTAAQVQSPAEIERAIDAFAVQPSAGMIVLASPFAQAHRELTIGLAAKHRLPAMYGARTYAASGGLMSYSSDWVDQYRQAASYVDRILRGARPTHGPAGPAADQVRAGDQSQTAKALGLDVPLFLQQRADEVIE
jgi:ABC-type uncharacterized transport system substrate-binding protein